MTHKIYLFLNDPWWKIEDLVSILEKSKIEKDPQIRFTIAFTFLWYRKCEEMPLGEYLNKFKVYLQDPPQGALWKWIQES